MTTNLSRRSFVKASGAAVCIGTLASAGAAFAEEGPLTPGIYKATAAGYAGHNTVYVTVDATSILDVQVGESTDAPDYLTQFPIAQIPARIVEAQSTDVDVVTGATFTSYSIMSAARACIDQAGGKGLFETPVEPPVKTAGETVETDVLVIGGGFSGLVAAMSAAQENLDMVSSGIKVTVLEKQDFIGGSLPLAIGGIFTTTPTNELPSRAHIDWEIKRMSALNLGKVNAPLIEHLLNVSGDTMDKLQKLGVPMRAVDRDSKVDWDNRPLTFGITSYASCPFGSKGETGWGRGRHIIECLKAHLGTLGVDIRIKTAATELIIEDGVVVGAMVEGPQSVYEIRAKKTILSCGGISQNREMIKQYAPHDADSLIWCNGGADGDGIRMGVEAGGRTVGDRLWGHVATDNVHGIHNTDRNVINATGFIVNTNGEKFYDGGKDNAITYALIAEQPGKIAFGIVDSLSGFAAQLDGRIAEGADCVFRADTLEELAEACGIDIDGLRVTIEAQNEYLANRGEVSADAVALLENPEYPDATPIATPPFYAIRYVQVHPASCVSLVVDGDCRVLDSVDEPIPNLYATGECCIGGNVFDFHVGAWGLGGALYSGRIAGEDAKAAIRA